MARRGDGVGVPQEQGHGWYPNRCEDRVSVPRRREDGGTQVGVGLVAPRRRCASGTWLDMGLMSPRRDMGGTWLEVGLASPRRDTGGTWLGVGLVAPGKRDCRWHLARHGNVTGVT